MTPDLLRREVSGRLSGAQEHVVAGAGHLLPLEAPDEVALASAGVSLDRHNWRVKCNCSIIAPVGDGTMSQASPEIQQLAKRILASEAARGDDSLAGGDVAQVIQELRALLIRLAGVDGFRSLLSRALALGKPESPVLSHLHLRADGFLEGFETMQAEEAAQVERAGLVLVAHLLGLLVTFIGEPLTLRLLRGRWADAVESRTDSKEQTS